MKLLVCSLYLALAFSATAQFAFYNDTTIPKPSSGYGADGSHTVTVDSIVNPNFSGKQIYLYHPSDIQGKLPTLFYSHAFGGVDPLTILGLLRFVARKGYAIVFVPYQTSRYEPTLSYNTLISGFRLAVDSFPDIIDTSRVGFVGYSFGGGATFYCSYHCFVDNNWGTNSRLVMALAPFYTFNLSQTALQSFPSNTKLLIEIYSEDSTVDHGMAMEIFHNINVPSEEKDFLLVRSDTLDDGHIYWANHGTPSNGKNLDALDYYGIFRLLDALCDYSFNGSLEGKNVALGKGSAAQVTMPAGLKSLVQFDDPRPFLPSERYDYPCDTALNPRATYCLSPATTLTENRDKETISLGHLLNVSPNPFCPGTQIRYNIPTSAASTPVSLTIYNTHGQVVTELVNHITIGSGNHLVKWDANKHPAGLYFIRFQAGAYCETKTLFLLK